MMPTKLTNSVLSTPTRKARAYVSDGEYEIGLSLMSKPALRPRKLNPKPRPRASIALSRLRTMRPTTIATIATTTTCAAMRRTRSSRHGAMAEERCGSAVMGGGASAGDGRAPAPAGQRRLSVRWRVEQAALGPQVVQPSVEVERRPRTQVAVVDLAVVADGTDHVDDPVGLEAQPGLEWRGRLTFLG